MMAGQKLYFRSTRNPAHRVPFSEALLKGPAGDGGLYLPETLPPLPADVAFSRDAFPDLGVRILAPWVAGAMAAEAAAACIRDALSFPVPLVRLTGPGWDGIKVLELFHGPTLSFKDFGARTMARLMGGVLERGETAQTVTVLVATSGDTGSAVADGFAGQHGIEVVLLYPRGQVSPTQERQLIVARPGVRAFAVQGTFDDCQRMVKDAFRDPALAHRALTSANSINIGRLLPQMLYYVEAFRKGRGEEVRFCVPSGNLGNLTGGVLAMKAGLTVKGFIAAHNANAFFPRFLSGHGEAPLTSVRTLSNAMDVGVPSNFERLKVLLPGKSLHDWIRGTTVSDDETLKTMAQVYQDTGYVADPHTAVGLCAARRYRRATGARETVVVLSTAHPAKFPDVVERALGFRPDPPGILASLWDRPVEVASLSPTAEALREVLG